MDSTVPLDVHGNPVAEEEEDGLTALQNEGIAASL